MLKKILREEKNAGEEGEILKMCRKCYSFGYDNGWHFEKPRYLLAKDLDERISVEFSQCPSCVEEALAVYDMEYV